ncbi:MAG: LIC_10190 family membrane protein, partial [Spirulinaceae cyanobacterium]
MLALLLGWCCLGLVTAAIGLGLLNVLKLQAVQRLGDRLIVSIWLGILLLAWLLFGLSLLLPLSPSVGLGVILILMATAGVQRSSRQELRRIFQQLWACPLGFKLVIVGLSGAIAALASQPIIWPDTGLYHYQATRWFAEYGTVPGLALVHHRFGTNSAWFALAAPLDVGGLAERQNTLLGGFLFWIETLQLAYTIRRLLKGENTRINWFVCLALFLLMPTLVWGYLPVSNSPDLPVLFVSFLVAWLILLIAPQPPQRQIREAILPLLIAALTAAIKLSALPLIALVLVFYGRQYRAAGLLKRVSIGITITIASLLPLLSFNFITSGCFL